MTEPPPAGDPTSDDPPAPVTYSRVLAAYDGSEPSDGAFELAAYLADHLDAQLEVAHVVESPGDDGDAAEAREVISRLVDARERYWDDRLGHLVARAAPRLAVRPVVLTGAPADELLGHAERTNADLVVAGTHGVGHVKQALFGSVSHRLLRHAACDLLFVREPLPLDRAPAVLVGLDASKAAQRAVEVADGLAQALNSSLGLVHVAAYPPFGGSLYLEEETRASIRAGIRKHGHEHFEHARSGLATPAARIFEERREGYLRSEMLAACADHAPAIIVVGTRGTGGFPGLLVGSVTRDLLDYSDNPVLVVRPPVDPT